MKKKILVLLLLIPFFTACGNDRKLICYEEINDGEYKQSLIMNYNKEKTKVDSSSIEIIIDLKEMSLSDLGCTKETKEECFEELKAKYNSGCENMLENCNIENQNENGFTFTATIKEDKMEEYFGDISTTLPINQMRSKIETKFGFTCE